jgi:hypothetical protein
MGPTYVAKKRGQVIGNNSLPFSLGSEDSRRRYVENYKAQPKLETYDVLSQVSIVLTVFHTEMYAANGCFSFLVSGCSGYSKMPSAADWVSFCCLYFMFSWLFPVHTQY